MIKHIGLLGAGGCPRDQGDITLVCPIMGTSSPLTGLRHAWTSGLEDSGDTESGMNVGHDVYISTFSICLSLHRPICL